MSKIRLTFYTKWDEQELKCACYIKNPRCKYHKECEELELTLSVYDGIEECMRTRKYKKEHGVIKQTGR